MAQFTFTETTKHSYTEDTIETKAFHIPSAIADVPQWITFRLEEGDDGKMKKKPCDTSITQGKYGPFVKYSGVRSPENFTDYMSAIEFVKETNRRDDVKGLDGVGFVFTESDNFVGVDLDDCVRTADAESPQSAFEIKQFANKFLGSVDSFAEFSPSGTGIHIIARGELSDDYKNRNDGLGVEMYEDSRFFTVTGDRIEGTPGDINDCTENLQLLQQKYMDEADDFTEADFSVSDDGSSSTSDASVVKTAKSYSDKFTRLYEGGGNPDTSRGDLAFCRSLAFWTGEDKRQMERIWKNSGRARKKLERDDYVQNTISKAISFNDDTFSGSYK